MLGVLLGEKREKKKRGCVLGIEQPPLEGRGSPYGPYSLRWSCLLSPKRKRDPLPLWGPPTASDQRLPRPTVAGTAPTAQTDRLRQHPAPRPTVAEKEPGGVHPPDRLRPTDRPHPPTTPSQRPGVTFPTRLPPAPAMPPCPTSTPNPHPAPSRNPARWCRI